MLYIDIHSYKNRDLLIFLLIFICLLPFSTKNCNFIFLYTLGSDQKCPYTSVFFSKQALEQLTPLFTLQMLFQFGVIYGGAQKNIGTSGVALVIVREDLLNYALPICPSILDWSLNNKSNSILNTPPMFA